MKPILLVLLLSIAAVLNAQDKTVEKLKTETNRSIARDAADTLPKTWKVGGVVGLNVAQTSLSNWAAGGDDFSISLNFLSSLYAFYKKNRSSWDNTLDLALGYLKTTSQGERKTDDKFDLLSKYGYAISKKWNLAALFNFRSQFFNGYTYTTTSQKFNSTFLSPGYVTLGIGLDYKPNDNFSLFFSPATVRVTLMRNDTLSAKGLYGVEPGEHHHVEFGAFLSATYIKALNKIVTYKGRLDLFSNYKHNPQNIDVNFSNLFAVKVSNWVTVNWNLDMIYDDDAKLFGKNGTSPALQVKSLIGVGILVKFNNWQGSASH
jgi:DUF3078 family protein